MVEATATPAAAPEGKDAIYVQIGDFVKDKTGKRIGKTGGREIFDIVTAEIFALAAREGAFRFNGGFGSLHVKTYQPGTRRLPNGTETTFGVRQKLRYEEGVVTKALVKNKGNLPNALEARGKRTRATPAVEPEAAAPAESASKEGEDDLDLD